MRGAQLVAPLPQSELSPEWGARPESLEPRPIRGAEALSRAHREGPGGNAPFGIQSSRVKCDGLQINTRSDLLPHDGISASPVECTRDVSVRRAAQHIVDDRL